MHGTCAILGRYGRAASRVSLPGRGAHALMLVLASSVFLAAGASAMAYESSYEPTPVGTTEIKELPATRVLETEEPGRYFDVNNRTFMTLFRYIQNNKISMTVPVEAEMKPARMRFFVGSAVSRELPSGKNGVTVREVPARKVASVGIRGSYSAENFDKGVADVRAWLAKHPEWVAAGEPYAVYWNGPFVPWFLKRSEVHISVTGR